MNERVSIIIPAYNIEKEIERCVDSVLSQTYQNIEVIIVNDGSTDGTLNILKLLEKKDHRIKLVDKVNEGVTKARLTGFEHATGEWIGFVDGDDYVEPEMYEHLLKNAYKYGADISHCGYQMVFPSRVDFYYNTGYLMTQDNRAGLKDLLSNGYVEPGLWNKIYRRALIQHLLDKKSMDLSIKNTEDLLMNFYLFREAELAVYEDFCPYHYIVRRTSAANRTINEHQLLDPLRVSEKLIEELRNDSGLTVLVQKKKLRELISLASKSDKENAELIAPIKKMALKKLRSEMKSTLKEKRLGIKLRIVAVWVCLWPNSYGMFHWLYLKGTGRDKIYEIS